MTNFNTRNTKEQTRLERIEFINWNRKPIIISYNDYDYIRSNTPHAIRVPRNIRIIPRNIRSCGFYPCCPKNISKTPLHDYLENIKNSSSKIIFKNSYNEYRALEAELSEDNKFLAIQCCVNDKNFHFRPLGLLLIAFKSGFYIHDYESCHGDNYLEYLYNKVLGRKATISEEDKMWEDAFS